MSFLPTSQLIADPGLAALVEQLAPASRIESAHIGYAGSPSEVHALFTRISKAATAPQLVALLRHDSAVVRGYAAEHVVANFPTELAAVYPLLADSAKVEEMSGCTISSTTVSEVVLAALQAQLERPAVQALLVRAAHDPQLGELRAEALQVVAKRRPAEASALARGLLRESEPQLLAAAIRTLGMTATEDCAESLCALAGAAEREVRAAVAAALGALHHGCVEPTLRKLTTDGDDYVRVLAGASYARTPQRDPAVVRQLFRDRAHRVKVHTALALAGRADGADLALLREYLAAEPSSSEVISALAKTRRDEVTAFMRELLGGTLQVDVLTRAQALGYLRDVADRQSLPLFIQGLQSSYIGERTAAAEGLGALGERSAVAALGSLLADQNPHGRLAAARALVKLGASEAGDAVNAAAAQDSSWAKDEMKGLARQLQESRGKDSPR